MRESTNATCSSTGGSFTGHAYDEADRLTDPGTTYEPFGGATVVPASDAGGHVLESHYYANGGLYNKSQGTQTSDTRLIPPEGT